LDNENEIEIMDLIIEGTEPDGIIDELINRRKEMKKSD